MSETEHFKVTNNTKETTYNDKNKQENTISCKMNFLVSFVFNFNQI
jgi:hypothetical protein